MEEKILSRFDDMIKLGDRVLSTRPNPKYVNVIDTKLAYQWFTSSIGLISKVLGKQSEHYKAMSRNFVASPNLSHAEQAYGVLCAAKDDVINGALFEVKSLVSAELFDDFLQQAEHLIEQKYYAPAAVIIGAVLEDGLRNLCSKHSITIPEKPKLDSMNSELAKANVYKTLTQKKVTALADIRNSAAHGKWNEFTLDDVKDMAAWTRNFMERHFAE